MKSDRQWDENSRAAKLSGFSSPGFLTLLASVLGAIALVVATAPSLRSQQPPTLMPAQQVPQPVPLMQPRPVPSIGAAVRSEPLLVQPQSVPPILPGTWLPVGPAPIQNGQENNVSPNNEVSGAISTVVAQPGNANVIYVGAVNGGIWKTTNGTASDPTWTPLTDNQSSASIGVIKFDPTDTSHNTLVAGIAFPSSFRVGGPSTGLLRTSDAGKHWTAINGGGVLTGQRVNGVAARGSTIVSSGGPFEFCPVAGIFRSTNGGTTFTKISGLAGSGLPVGKTFDLAEDPNNNAILYTAVANQFGVSCAGEVDGIYKSTDTGATWSKISNSTIDALLPDATPGTSNVKITVGTSNNVYVGIVLNNSSTGLDGLFRSGDGGATWQSLDSSFNLLSSA